MTRRTALYYTVSCTALLHCLLYNDTLYCTKLHQIALQLVDCVVLHCTALTKDNNDTKFIDQEISFSSIQSIKIVEKGKEKLNLTEKETVQYHSGRQGTIKIN